MPNLINYDNGTVTVSVTGGTAPYSFLLQQNGTAFNYSGANFINPISSSSGQVTFGDSSDQSGDSGVPAGVYTCQVTDANGCVTTTPNLTVNQDIPTTTTAAPTYTVTINAVADPANIVGSHPYVSQGLSAGSSYTIPAPTWSVTGYTFIGYDTYSGTPMAAPEYQPGDILTISGDVNLYARYEAVTTTTTTLAQYTLNINAIADPSLIVGTHPYIQSGILDGSTVVLPAPTWSVTGYTFIGYDTYSGTPMAPPQYQPGDSLVVTGNVNLYARYEAVTTTTTTTEPTTTTSTTSTTTTTTEPTTTTTTTEPTTTTTTSTTTTTTEPTTTTTTTEPTTTTTTSTTTTTTTTTAAPETGYFFHLGTGAYPWQQELISGTTFYYPNNDPETSFAPIFEDMLVNPSGYPGFDPNDSFVALNDGDILNYPDNANGNYYWLLLPDSYNIPDLTQNAKLSIDGAPDDICSEKGALTINGISYTLYKLNTVPTTADIAVTYNA